MAAQRDPAEDGIRLLSPNNLGRYWKPHSRPQPHSGRVASMGRGPLRLFSSSGLLDFLIITNRLNSPNNPIAGGRGFVNEKRNPRP